MNLFERITAFKFAFVYTSHHTLLKSVNKTTFYSKRNYFFSVDNTINDLKEIKKERNVDRVSCFSFAPRKKMARLQLNPLLLSPPELNTLMHNLSPFALKKKDLYFPLN